MLLGEQRLLRVYLGTLICGVAITFFWLRLTPDKGGSDTSNASRWIPSTEDIESQRAQDRAFLRDFVSGEGERAFIEMMEEFHLYEAGMEGAGKSQEYGDKSHEYRLRVEAYVKRYGMTRYRQIGLSVRRRFVVTLQGILGAETFDVSVSKDRSSDESDLYALSGNFLTWARQIALIPAKAPLDDGDLFLVETLFKFRWLRWADRLEPVETNITRFEKSVVLAFQVERYQGLVLSRRLELIAELGALVPEYPVDRAHIEVLIDSGNFKEAKEYLLRRLSENPGDEALVALHRRLFGGLRD